MNSEQITKTELRLMTCKEVAELLKVKIGTIYSWIGYRQIPDNIYRKLGKKPIFIYDEVIKWFLDGAKLKKRPCKGGENGEV